MKQWEKSEEEWAALFPTGQRQVGSGNKQGAPGDIRFVERIGFKFSGKALLESKQTSRGSLSIETEWLKKITNEAMMLGRTPLFGMDIQGQRWLAIPEWAIEIEKE